MTEAVNQYMAIFRKLIIVSSYLCAAYLILNSFKNESGDFGIYYQAAFGFRNGEIPYFFDAQSNNMYLNGPIFGILLIPFTYLSAVNALTAWRILTICLTVVLFRCLYKGHNQSILSILLPIFIIAFPWRNNFANTSLVIISLALLVFFYKWTLEGKQVHAAIVLCLALELKPYIALPFLLFIFIDKNWLVIKYVFLYTLVMNVIYYVIWKTSYIDWLNSIFSRSGYWTKGDQSTIRTMLWKYLAVPESVATLVGVFSYLLMILLVISRTHGKDLHGSGVYLYNRKFLACLTLAPLFPLYSHEQDYLFSLFGLIALMTFYKFYEFGIFVIVPGFFILNWSNESLVAGLFFSVLMTVLYLMAAEIFSIKSTLILFPLIIALTIAAIRILIDQGSMEQFYFHNLLALLFGVSTFILFIRSTFYIDRNQANRI